MRARYIRPGSKSWILVDVIDRCGDFYHIVTHEWYGVTKKAIYVPIELIEFLSDDRP